MELPPDKLPGGWVTSMRDSRGELLIKSCCHFQVAGEGFGGKGGRLIGRGFIKFPIKEFDYTQHARRATFMRECSNGLGPFQSIRSF